MGKVNIIGNNLTDDFVSTPGGIIQKENVHLLKEGLHLKIKDRALFEINNDNGKLNKIAEIASATEQKVVERATGRKTQQYQSDVTRPITDRWIIYAGWMNQSSSPITYFKTRWVVPEAPATDNGQLIYLFNGIENRSFDLILQPVLQWGLSPAGGGSYWSLTNWFVGAPGSGTAVHKELAPVEPGDIIEGIMELIDSDGDEFSYRSSFKGFPQCDLLIEGCEELCWANETLECYGLRSFSDYPNTVKTEMTNIEIRIAGAQAKIQWEVYNDVTDNGQHCSIQSNASPGGIVKLYYKNDIDPVT